MENYIYAFGRTVLEGRTGEPVILEGILTKGHREARHPWVMDGDLDRKERFCYAWAEEHEVAWLKAEIVEQETRRVGQFATTRIGK